MNYRHAPLDLPPEHTGRPPHCAFRDGEPSVLTLAPPKNDATPAPPPAASKPARRGRQLSLF